MTIPSGKLPIRSNRARSALPPPKAGGLFKAVAALFLFSLVASIGAILEKHAYERASTSVILAVDGDEAARTAAGGGVPPEEFLRLLRAAGATAVGVHEYTLEDAVDDGRAFVVSESALRALWPGAAETAAVVEAGAAVAAGAGADGSGGPEAVARATAEPSSGGAAPRRYLGIAVQGQEPWFVDAVERRIPGSSFTVAGGAVRLWPLPERVALSNMSLGFDPGEVATVVNSGLDIVPRFRPAGAEAWEEALRSIGRIPPEATAAIVFWGAEVTGYPDALDEAAAAFAQFGAPLGLVEFAEQRGMKALARALDYRAVRVHSITPEEMEAGIARDVALRRWERAVRERGVRLAYVRFYPEDSPAEAAEYVRAVAERLRAAGFTLGRAGGPQDGQGAAPPRAPLWALLLGSGVVAGAGGWLASLVGFRPLRRRSAAPGGTPAALWFPLPVLGGVAGFSLLWLKGYTILARQAFAGLTAALFPALAVLVGLGVAKALSAASGEPSRRGVRTSRERDGGRAAAPGAATEGAADAGAPATGALRRALAAFAACAAVTVSGAALVALFLDDLRFVLKIEEFRGVKAAYVAPLAIVALAQLRAWRAEYGGAGATSRPWPLAVKAWLTAPVKVWHVLLGVAGAGLLAIYLLRSGNQGLPLFGFEAGLRAFLEEAFVARPRIKEFLVGHPAAMAAFAAAAAGIRRRVAAPLVALLAVAGAVGPVSVLNTFAHAHSPVALSAARTAYGIAIGAILGLVAATLLLALLRRAESRTGRAGKRGAAGSETPAPESDLFEARAAGEPERMP